jgi:hypothetical protein
MAVLGQNIPFNRTFILVLSTDHVSPALGARPIVQISKNGLPFTSPEGTVNEIGNGWYNLALTTDDTNTLGMLSYHITALNTDPTDINDEILQSAYIAYVPPPSYSPPIDTVPTLYGYINWIYAIMGVPTAVLPNTSPYIELSFEMALETVNLYLDIASPLLYTQAVYNLGGDILVNITQDDPSLASPNNTYWANLRQSLSINNFIPGMINASNDEDTSAALLVPLGLQNLTLSDLQNLKTPWGRAYLGIAQSVGSMWGLTM